MGAELLSSKYAKVPTMKSALQSIFVGMKSTLSEISEILDISKKAAALAERSAASRRRPRKTLAPSRRRLPMLGGKVSNL